LRYEHVGAMDSVGDPQDAGIMQRLRRLTKAEGGQAMVEYALILVLMVVIIIVVLIVMGNTVKNMYCNVAGALGSP
jgi:Flp pilus assembly pilin Flp